MVFKNKIMVVDDDTDIQFSLRVIFENEGYEVVTVNNGLECLDKLNHGFKGIIILDIMMPVMDGIETIKKMAVEGFVETNKIIVLTVKKFQGEEFDEIYKYITEYIQKPFDVNILIKTVNKTSKKCDS